MYWKKIFKKEAAEEFLRKEKPHLFKKTKKGNYKYVKEAINFWKEFDNISIYKIKDFVREYVFNDKNGKYYYIHRNLEKTQNLIKQTIILKKNSPCYPENFSEQVVKKNTRLLIPEYYEKNLETEELLNRINEMDKPKLVLHEKERVNQQVKADYTEYLLLQADESIIPTIPNTKGTDMYKIENEKLVDLDIKTTRSIFEIKNNPELVIKTLYEKQGETRFSSKSRTYIYIHNNFNPEHDYSEIKKQLNRTYNINFSYKKKDYYVENTRLIQIM